MVELPGVDPKMIANNIEPAFATHPGSILKDEIEYRGITQQKLAQQMGVPYSALNEILNGHRPLTEKTALLFEAVLGIDAEPLLALQTEYNLRSIRKDFFRFCIPPSVNHRIMYSGGKQRPYRRMENPFVCFSVCF